MEDVKKELLQGRQELERAKELIGSQRHAFEEEGADLQKVGADFANTLQTVGQRINEFMASLRKLEQPSEKLNSWVKELSDLANSAMKEIDSQRKELSDAASKVKMNLDRVAVQRSQIEEQFATLRTERESRAASRLRGVCPACGRGLRPEDMFCDKCGASLL